jgi:spore maturation protein CgeB
MSDSLQSARTRLRAWRNRRRLEKERDFYEDAFRSSSLKIPGEAEIQAVMRQRFPNLKPKPKGTIRTLAIWHNYNWETDALKPSLEQFGPVRLYDWYGEFDHSRKNWRRDLKPRMNRALVDLVDTWCRDERPDVIFTYLSGELVWPETVQAMRSQGIPIVNLALNDKEHFVGKLRGGRAFGMRDICRHFDLCWTSTEDALKKYCVEGALPLYLPEGANPEVHRPHDVELSIDVAFVGQCYGNRPEVIRKLQESGIRAEAFGFGWPNGALATDEMVKMYSRSRINLGFGGVAGHDDTYCLKGRDFEIPMSGGLYVTESCAELGRFFRPGQEVVTYGDFDDLVEKIRHLLSHPEEAERIRNAGFERARSEHTWEMRFEKVFKHLEVLEQQP